eukprot:scaffold11762_cov90-Cylindrotheca_fusiformis.AAC.2
MQHRSSTMRRSITAVASAPSTITFDLILPMLSEDNSILRRKNGLTIHLKIVELIKLFAFSSSPGKIDQVPILQ